MKYFIAIFTEVKDLSTKWNENEKHSQIKFKLITW